MQKSTTISLFERFKQFINSLPVGSTYTTDQLYNAVGQYESTSRWKQWNRQRMYRTSTYQTYLRRLGALQNVKRAEWRILSHVPEWFNTKHMNIHLGYTYHYVQSERKHITITCGNPWKNDRSVGINPWDAATMLDEGIPSSMIALYYLPKSQAMNPFIPAKVEVEKTQPQPEPEKTETTSVSVAAYNALVNQGLEIGAKVKVLAKWPSYSPGFDCLWNSDMNSTINTVGTVTDITINESTIDKKSEYRVAVRCEKTEFSWWYPTMVLQVTAPAPKIINVKLNDSYTAEVDVTNGVVKVGCQTIPFQSIYDVLDAMKSK